jgi:hypothetical protein
MVRILGKILHSIIPLKELNLQIEILYYRKKSLSRRNYKKKTK